MSSELPQPPYPADVRAKGMVFHVDMERVKQSKAWNLCPTHLRGQLFLLWAESWVSEVAGSFSNDDEEISSRIGMDVDLFAAHRKHLMRGWYLASDDRLYHPFITTLVEQMRNARLADRVRKAAQREAKAKEMSHGTTPMSHGTSAMSNGTPLESVGVPPPGTGTGTGIEEREGEELGSPPLPSAVAECPHEAIINAFHAAMPTAKRVKDWTSARQGLLRARWREDKRRQSVEWWEKFFVWVNESDFLAGRTQSQGRKPFYLGLEWLLKSENFAKVREGQYHDGVTQ